jgi:hypothetical protein
MHLPTTRHRVWHPNTALVSSVVPVACTGDRRADLATSYQNARDQGALLGQGVEKSLSSCTPFFLLWLVSSQEATDRALWRDEITFYTPELRRGMQARRCDEIKSELGDLRGPAKAMPHRGQIISTTAVVIRLTQRKKTQRNPRLRSLLFPGIRSCW